MFSVTRKGQSTLEYVVLIGFVVAALIAMGIYMKRGFQGKLRESTDQVGEQYEARNTTSQYQITTHLKQTETMTQGGHTTVTIDQGDNTQTKKQIAAETVAAWEPR